MSARVCSVEFCESGPILARGFCKFHYSRWHSGRPLQGPVQNSGEVGRAECSVSECDLDRDMLAGMGSFIAGCTGIELRMAAP